MKNKVPAKKIIFISPPVAFNPPPNPSSINILKIKGVNQLNKALKDTEIIKR